VIERFDINQVMCRQDRQVDGELVVQDALPHCGEQAEILVARRNSKPSRNAGDKLQAQALSIFQQRPFGWHGPAGPDDFEPKP
jgi:hypothetical protein